MVSPGLQMGQIQFGFGYDASRVSEEKLGDDGDSVLTMIQQWIAEEELSSSGQMKEPKGEPSACLFVASLNVAKTEEQLTRSVTRHFGRFGKLLHVKVLKDPANRPYAFVQYEKRADAQKAMKLAQNAILDTRHIRIEAAKVNRTLFIARFPKTITDEKFRRLLEQFGELEEFQFGVDENGEPKGSVTVKFAHREDALRCFGCLRTLTSWVVDWFTSKSSPEIDVRSIFVGNLNPTAITDDMLRERFGQYGEIESVELIKTPSRLAFAFVRFTDAQSVSDAIQAENDQFWLGNNIKVTPRRLRRTSSVTSPMGRGGRHPTWPMASYPTMSPAFDPQFGMMAPETLMRPQYIWLSAPTPSPAGLPSSGPVPYGVPMPMFAPMMPAYYDQHMQQFLAGRYGPHPEE